jgi:hypothetical protein
MGLAELVARRDVGDFVSELEIRKPRRVSDMKVIDRMQVVVETGLRDLTCRKAAAVIEPALDQQHLQAGPGEITPKDQAVMARADDDPVVAAF